MLERQKKEEGEALISTLLFDDTTEVLHDRVPLYRVEKLTDRDYYVRGCTALLDAVGGAVRHIERVQQEMPEEERPEKTLFIITTDGMENASREYTYPLVKRMVEEKKEKDFWEFIFLGANIDAVEVAGKFGVSSNRAVRFENDSVGTQLNFKVMSEMVTRARVSESARQMQASFDEESLLDPIRQDYEKRHEKGSAKETGVVKPRKK